MAIANETLKKMRQEGKLTVRPTHIVAGGLTTEAEIEAFFGLVQQRVDKPYRGQLSEGEHAHFEGISENQGREILKELEVKGVSARMFDSKLFSDAKVVFVRGSLPDPDL